MARRKFNGKYYHESMIRYSKKDAQAAAKRIREKGGQARITKDKKDKFWVIWERG